MDWIRGDALGFGSFSTVSLAFSKTFSHGVYPSLMAVKSCDIFDSALLKNEKEVLQQLGGCRHIIKCFGDDQTVENSRSFYNVFLEYASGGSLVNHVKNSGNKLPESEAGVFTRSVLMGLRYIHGKGFVHCDIKLQNILVSNGEVKIADFGLAKKAGTKLERIEVRGTPLYMSPESINENEYEPPCDIWALGCVLLEMVTGKPPWNCKAGTNAAALLVKIGVSDELPSIPDELSDEVSDFLSKCFVKDLSKRWTAEMLLNHPFITSKNDAVTDETVLFKQICVEQDPTISPRGPLESHDWVSVASSSTRSELWLEKTGHNDDAEDCWSGLSRADERIKKLVSDEYCNWSDSEDWTTVR